MKKRPRPRHPNIPDDLMQRYLKRDISSRELSELTGYHAVYLRRSIKRSPLIPQAKNKIKLVTAREALRKSVAHLPLEEIIQKASVSKSTAFRIKKKYAQIL